MDRGILCYAFVLCWGLFSTFAVGRTEFLVKSGVGYCLLPRAMGRPLLSRFKQASGVLSVEVSDKAVALLEGEEASFPRPSNLSPWGK